MSETIPIDILDAAEQAAADLDDIHFNSRSASWLDDARDIVAAALMAERERCASIAELFIIKRNSIHPDIPFDELSQHAKNVAHAACQYVAAAIRTPSTGEER